MAGKPPETLSYEKACELVGSFLNAFAYMESELNNSLAELLGLGQLESLIVTNNMQMQGKINAFKTLINLRSPQGAWQKQAIKNADKIGDMASTRNTVVHVPFGVDDRRNAVNFLPVKAKGKLTFPDMAWTSDKFHELEQEMHSLRKEIIRITERLLSGHALIKAQAELTSGKPPSPETQRLLIRLLQGNPDSDTTSPETGLETDQSPEG